MRKRLTEEGGHENPHADYQDWLDLEHLVQVELTSEDPEYPIDSALDDE